MAYTSWHDFTAGETLTATLMDALVANLQAMFPVGSYCYIAKAATTSETLVNGVWLECNGVSVLRATYPDLNTLLSGLSYPFGTVDGTHFTLPDAQGRVAVSMASGGHADHNGLGDSDGLGKTSRTARGSVSVSSTVSTTGTTSSEASHTHGAGSYSVTVPSTGSQYFSTSGPSPAAPGAVSVTGSSAAGSSHSHTTSATGSGSGSGTVPGNYLVAGVLHIKAVA